LHFHSNVTVILHNNGFVAVSITMDTAVQKHYYGYGSAIYVRESLRDSCVLEGEQIGRVLAGCDFRSVI
jgi:hypothetical protein